MALKLRKLSYALGAEVCGIDVAAPMSEAAFGEIYRAFLDPAALCKWIAPAGYTCTVHHLDAKVGGTFKMSFHNFSTGDGHSFGGEYRELVPNELVRYTDKFDDPNLKGEMQVTVFIKQVSCGTELNIVQEGIPEAIPPEMCLSPNTEMRPLKNT